MAIYYGKNYKLIESFLTFRNSSFVNSAYTLDLGAKLIKHSNGNKGVISVPKSMVYGIKFSVLTYRLGFQRTHKIHAFHTKSALIYM